MKDLVYKALNDGFELGGAISEKIENLSLQLRINANTDSLTHLKQLIEDISVYFEYTLFMRNESSKLSLLSIKNFYTINEEKWKKLFGDIIAAQEQMDWILIADLLEYELKHEIDSISMMFSKEALDRSNNFSTVQ
jgi:hypothetical protein